jgi:succinyl-CoA synthetase beta subunit
MNLKNLDRIDDIITAARNEDREALYFAEAAEVMESIGVPVIESVVVRDEKDLKKIKKYPAVIKVDSDRVLHKTDQGGLVLDIPDEPKLREAWIKMKSFFSGERIIVQPMVSRKIELIIGMKRDESFGPVVVVGLGGIYTEIFKTVDFFLPPGGSKYAEEWLKKSRIGFLFTGARGEFYDPKPVAEIITGIGQLCLAEKKIISLDINPLLIYNDGRSPLAVDVKVLI